MLFEPNVGQHASPSPYLARANGYTVAFDRASIAVDVSTSPDASQAALGGRTVVLSFAGANAATSLEPERLEPSTTNYLLGDDDARWRSGVPNYAALRYRELWPGIDAVFYDSGGQIEYDFEVGPGADPEQIRVSVSGVDGLSVEPNGDLRLGAGSLPLVLKRPVAYQGGKPGDEPVPVEFEIRDNQFSFRVGLFDRSRRLVIDPTLVYSSYLGGEFDQSTGHIVLDASGSPYVAGCTKFGFPSATPPAVGFGPGANGNCDAFVTKLNVAGTGRIYTTYFGGIFDESVGGIAIDAAGSAYVAGSTSSPDFPTQNPYQATKSTQWGWNAFVTKLSPAGTSLVYSTYLGGTNYAAILPGGSPDTRGTSIGVDSFGSAILGGYTGTDDYPTQNAFQASSGGGSDAILTKFSPDGSTLIFSTYLGGNSYERAEDVAIDASGSAYLVGVTASANFPVQNAYQPTLTDNIADTFVTKFDPTGGSLIYSTYLDGAYPRVDADALGNAYVARLWNSAVVTKFDPSGTALIYSASLEGADAIGDIAVNTFGEAVIVGLDNPGSTPLRTKNGMPVPNFPFTSNNAFVAMFNAAGSDLVYSTLLGGWSTDGAVGVAVDAQRNAYVAGYTASADFPTRAPFQPGPSPMNGSFLSKISIAPASRSFLAEGATAGGFETWVLISNPDSVESADASLTFLTGGGAIAGPTVTIPPQSRRSVRVNDYVSTYDVSTVVEGIDKIVYAERAMYSTHPGHVGATLGKEFPRPRSSWFLPEGATAGGFETWVLVANPDPLVPANVSLTYWTGSGAVGGPAFVLPPLTRRSIRVNDTVETYEVSTRVDSTGAHVIAERATYVDNGTYRGATNSPGVEYTGSTWYVAEGASAGGMETWILVANPSPQSANASITYFTAAGPVPGPSFPIGPMSRKSVRVNDTISTFDVATRVVGSGTPYCCDEGGRLVTPGMPLLVERAMYSTSGSPRGLTASTGEASRAPATRWLLPEGATAGGFETWVLVANPDAVSAADVTINYLTGSGPVAGPNFTLAPRSRKSVRVNETVTTFDVSTEVTSTGSGVIVDHTIFAQPGPTYDSSGGLGIVLG